MPLDDIVNVQITSQTQTVSQPGFGIPMIFGINKSWNDFARSYSSLKSVGNDFTSNQPEYIAAQAVFSQNPSPTGVVIGRRQCDVATLNVLTPLANTTYTVTVNGLAATVMSQNLQQVSTITWGSNFNSNNIINVIFNGNVLGTINSIITFSTNFITGNVITPTVNGVTLASTTFATNHADTIAAVATVIASASGVASAVASGDIITVVFTNPGANTVNSVIVEGGASQPTVAIAEGGFPWDTNQATTLGDIATAIEAQSGVDTVVTGTDMLTITSVAGAVNVVNDATVVYGTAVTTLLGNNSLAKTIALALVTSINGLGSGAPVTANYVTSPDGTFTITANVSGTAYTLAASTTVTIPNVCIVEVTDATPNNDYFVTINGATFEYTSTVFDTAYTIVGQFVTMINNASPPVTVSATDNANGSFTITSNVLTTPFSIFVSAQVMSIIQGINILPYVASGVVATDLNNINNLNLDWYAIVCTDRTTSVVKAVAAWTESMPYIFGTASNDTNIINQALGTDTTSIAAFFQNQGYIRSFVLYNEDAPTEYAEAAWFGKVLPLIPGSETWKFKTLAGVTASNLTDNQSANALAKNCNTYEFIGGVSITQNGTMAQGEYIDTVRGIDWLKSTIVTNVYGLLVNSIKVPYTDQGITSIQAQVQKALDLGVSNNFLSDNPPPVVTVPLAANVPTIDKTNRVLNNVVFTATLAGAIHSVNITGTVSV
jgi:Protein of unknown function (DUF3383)